MRQMLMQSCDESASAAAAWRAPFLATPRQPIEGHVRRDHETDADWSDPFVVLRHTALLKHALRPSSLPSSLPALIEKRSILPGERCRFVFYAPSELLLVERAMQDGDNRFVHLTARPGRSSSPEDVEAASTASDAVGSVVTILSASALPFGRMVLECVAGPRCRISANRVELLGAMDEVERASSRPAERLLHVSPVLCSDELSVGAPPDERTDTLRRELAARLLQPSCAEVLSYVGMVPPLRCAERLSFFLCSLLLHADDVDHRLSALLSRSTRERLEFCKRAMDDASWGILSEASQSCAPAVYESQQADAEQVTADAPPPRQPQRCPQTQYIMYPSVHPHLQFQGGGDAPYLGGLRGLRR